MPLNSDTVLKSVQVSLLNVPCMSKLEKLLINCVFLNSILKLRIVNTLLTESEGHIIEENNSLVIHTENKGNQITLNEEEIHENILRAHHIKKNISFVLDALSNTTSEILLHGTQYCLPYITYCEKLKIYNNALVKHEHTTLTEEISELKEKIKNCKPEFYQICQYLSELANPCLEKSLRNTWVQEKMAENYKLRERKTHVEQKMLDLTQKQDTLQESVVKQVQDTVVETDVHSEIEQTLLDNTNDLTQKLNYWTERYNIEIDNIDTEILHMKNKLDDLKSQLQLDRDRYGQEQELLVKLRADVLTLKNVLKKESNSDTQC